MEVLGILPEKSASGSTDEEIKARTGKAKAAFNIL